jgi:glycosyltransferase involved in cell wall biosynthesis
MEKLMSVVIPSYNVEKFLRTTLDSFIIPKIMERLEVIIVNDGSKDSTLNIAKEYELRYPNTFQVVDKINGGHGSTINKGLELASGKYFKVVDGDDWVDKKALENLLNKLENYDQDIVATNYCKVEDDSGKMVNVRFNGVEYEKTFNFKEIFDKVNSIEFHSILYRTEILQKNNIKIDENSFYVDVEYILMPLRYVEKIIFIDEYLYMYRIGRLGQSISYDSLIKNRFQHKRVMLNSYYYILSRDTNIDNIKKRYILRRLKRMAEQQYIIELMMDDTKLMKRELMVLDREIKEQMPDIYNDLASVRKCIKVLRVTKFTSCLLVHKVVAKH